MVESMKDQSSYREVAASADVLVHAAVDNTKDTCGLDVKTMETLLAASCVHERARLYTPVVSGFTEIPVIRKHQRERGI